MCAYLLFQDPERLEKATEGQIFESIFKIVSIEWSFLRCEYAGREVRIYQNETTNDALARLRWDGWSTRHPRVRPNTAGWPPLPMAHGPWPEWSRRAGRH